MLSGGARNDLGGVRSFSLAVEKGGSEIYNVQTTSAPDAAGTVPVSLGILGTNNAGGLGGNAILFNVDQPVMARAQAANFNNQETDITVTYVPIAPTRSPLINAFRISPRMVNLGEEVTANWDINRNGVCRVKVSIRAQQFNSDRVLSVVENLPLTGSQSFKPLIATDYFLIAQSEGSTLVAQPIPRISVNVRNPSPEVNYFCFKVVFPTSETCRTVTYPASTQSEAQSKAEAEFSGDTTITSISCSEITTACGD